MATLLDLALKASLLMIVAGALIVLMRRASAASRHVALTAALGAAVLLPAARWALPALPVFVLAAEPQLAPAPPPPIETFAPDTTPMAIADANNVGPVNHPVSIVPSPEFVRASSPSWSGAGVIAALWLLGTAAVLVRMTVAGIRVRRLTRNAQPIVDARVNERLLEIRKQFGVARPVTLVASPHEWMPLTWGLMRPTILLPSSATAWIDTHPVRLDAVLLHEMAHIARWDAAWQRVARVAVALFWFNPLVLIAARRARLERERACDDAVLAQGLRATDYASDLVTIAQTLVLPSRAAEGALAMARRAQLEQRIEALLDGRLSHRSASRVSRMVAAALILLMLPMSAAQLTARQAAAPHPGALSGAVPDRAFGVQPIDQIQSQPVANPQAPQPAPNAPAIDNAPASPGPTFGIAWRPGLQNGILRSLTRDASPIIIEVRPAGDTQQQSNPLLTQSGKWALERDAMLRLLIERARTFVKDARLKFTIGTATSIDIKPLEDTLALVERAAGMNGSNWRYDTSQTTSFIAVNLPTDAQIADVKIRFNDAIRNLDAAEVRWDNGLLTGQDISAAVTAALMVLTEGRLPPEQVRFVSASGAHAVAIAQPADHLFTAANFPGSADADRNNARALYALLTGRVPSVSAPPSDPLSDADLIEMLKGAASVKTGSIKDDVERANALLALSSRYAFTPEMVTLYVAAARSLTTAAQQVRVFAQPIRVK